MDNEIVKMRLDHLGQIGFRLSLFAFIVSIAILLSSLISMFIFAFVAIFGFLLPFVTLGIVFVINPNYFQSLGNLLNNSNYIIDFFWGLTYYVKFIAIAGIIGSILGSIFLLVDKNNKQWGKFIFCLISSVCCLILFVLIISGTFNQSIIS